jgi:hypothetical protein
MANVLGGRAGATNRLPAQHWAGVCYRVTMPRIFGYWANRDHDLLPARGE